jgi:hypothetical protein
MELATENICGSKAASQSRNNKWLRKQKRKVSCGASTAKAEVKELRAHSKAKTPVDKIAMLTKRSVGSLRQKAHTLGLGLGHRR